jgi:hypothetical protein
MYNNAFAIWECNARPRHRHTRFLPSYPGGLYGGGQHIMNCDVVRGEGPHSWRWQSLYLRTHDGLVGDLVAHEWVSQHEIVSRTRSEHVVIADAVSVQKEAEHQGHPRTHIHVHGGKIVEHRGSLIQGWRISTGTVRPSHLHS